MYSKKREEIDLFFPPHLNFISILKVHIFIRTFKKRICAPTMCHTQCYMLKQLFIKQTWHRPVFMEFIIVWFLKGLQSLYGKKPSRALLSDVNTYDCLN